NSIVEERDTELQDKNSHIDVLGAELDYINSIVQEKTKELESIYVSKSWKIVKLLKYIRNPEKSLRYIKWKWEIKKSNMFDELFYLDKYPEIKNISINSILHYLEYGAEEGKNPNSHFNTRFYVENYPEVKDSGLNPFVHYIRSLNEEKKFANQNELDEEIIRASVEFDEIYYLETYSDIKENSIDPISHYVQYGASEGRNPNNKFNTNFYLERYADVNESGINPFSHYLLYGEKEDRTISIKEKNVHNYFAKNSFTPSLNIEVPIDIIIPVYNGYDYLSPLLTSIYNCTNIKYRLIVVNDASPDRKVLPLLKELLDKHNHVLIENKINKGFVKSVNIAMQYVKNHFVILNTDTEVPSGWLERLMQPIFLDKTVASTTPFTNAGTIASFPKFLIDNPIYKGLSVSLIDSYFKKIDPTELYYEVPTGVGFCMGVNYNVTKKIGFFDEITFKKGYGEENDWCQRAKKDGFRNIMVPNLFVYHKHGGSFPSEEKNQLITENYQLLLKKHPNYDSDIQNFILDDPYEKLRLVLEIMISLNEEESDVQLVFDHTLGGGANLYIEQLIEKRIKENKKTIEVKYSFSEKYYTLTLFSSNDLIELTVNTFYELQSVLERLS
ncbi:MAG: glycosyltransferase family 2 protein, partial [Bacteroidales bacterium]|nr:glycosyltransferase family 2 protein [Bacteroidales bacterium]